MEENDSLQCQIPKFLSPRSGSFRKKTLHGIRSSKRGPTAAGVRGSALEADDSDEIASGTNSWTSGYFLPPSDSSPQEPLLDSLEVYGSDELVQEGKSAAISSRKSIQILKTLQESEDEWIEDSSPPPGLDDFINESFERDFASNIYSNPNKFGKSATRKVLKPVVDQDALNWRKQLRQKMLQQMKKVLARQSARRHRSLQSENHSIQDTFSELNSHLQAVEEIGHEQRMMEEKQLLRVQQQNILRVASAAATTSPLRSGLTTKKQFKSSGVSNRWLDIANSSAPSIDLPEANLPEAIHSSVVLSPIPSPARTMVERSPTSRRRPNTAEFNYTAWKEKHISDPERVMRLSIPVIDKFAPKPQPPKYSIDYPEIPTGGIDDLYSIKNNFVSFHPCIDSLRLTIAAQVSANWENYANAQFRTHALPRLNIVNQDNNTGRSNWKHLHSLLRDKIGGFDRGCSADLASIQSWKFRHKFCLDFLCVVVDLNMQILGTYDPSMQNYVSGINMNPEFLNSRKVAMGDINKHRCSVLEIKFSVLPPEAFAVIPVILDQTFTPKSVSIFTDEPQPTRRFGREYTEMKSVSDEEVVKFRCDLFVHSSSNCSPLKSEHFVGGGRGGRGGGVEEDVESSASSDDDLDMAGRVSPLGKYPLRSMPQDYIRAQCDGLEDLWMSTSKRMKNLDLFTAQRLARWIHKQYQKRVLEGSDSDILHQDYADVQSMKNGFGQDEWRIFSSFSVSKTFSAHSTLGRKGTQSEIRSPLPSRSPSDASPQKRHSVSSSDIKSPSASPGDRLAANKRSSVSQIQQVKSSVKSNAASENPTKPASKFGVGEGFIPFVLFRNSGSFSTWSLLPIQKTTPAAFSNFNELLQTIFNLLVERAVLPYSVIHVEHCLNCESHQLTTRHVPGSYERAYFELRRALKEKLPPSLIYCNLKGVRKDVVDIGSFEVSLRPYGTKRSLVVFSKLRNGDFPKIDEVVEEMACLLMPETILFTDDRPTVQVVILDSYSKRCIPDAVVSLFRIESAVNSTAEPLEDISAMKSAWLADTTRDRIAEYEDLDFTLDKRSVNESTGIPLESKAHLQDNRDQACNQKQDSSVRKNKKSNDGVKSKLVRSSSPSDAYLRHSVGYAKVRAWSKQDVVHWLMAYGATRSIVDRAIAAGVVDGSSLLKLLTAANLEKWGVRGRIYIMKFVNGLQNICAEGANKRENEILMSRSLGFTTAAGPFVSELEESLLPAQCKVIAPINGIRKVQGRNYLDCSLFAVGKSDRRGIVKISIEKSGNYFVKISHPLYQDNCANSFRITGSKLSTTVSIAMQPILIPFLVVIKFDSVEAVTQFPFVGMLVSLQNMKSGLRHTIFTEYWKEYMGQFTVFVGEVWLPSGKYVSGVTGEVIHAEGTDKQKNSQMRKSLPIYYESSPHEKVIIITSHVEALRCHTRLMTKALTVFQRLYRKIRMRILRRGMFEVISAQKMLSRYINHVRMRIKNRKCSRIQSWWRMSVCRRKYLKIKRAVVKIQSLWRGSLSRIRLNRQREMAGAMFFLQAVKMDSSKQARTRQRRSGRIHVSHTTLIQSIRMKRNQAASTIQRIFKLLKYRRMYEASLRMKRAIKKLEQFVIVVRIRIRKKLAIVKEKKREIVEIVLMSVEEKLCWKRKQFELQQAEHIRFLERRKAEYLAKQLEIKSKAAHYARNLQAINIQRIFRGHVVRLWYRYVIRMIVFVQNFIRSRLAQKRNLEQLTYLNALADRRRLKEADSVPTDLDQQEIFGESTQPEKEKVSAVTPNHKSESLLHRIASVGNSLVEIPFIGKFFPVLHPDRNQRNSTESSMERTLIAVIQRHVVKIQSVWRMWRLRKRYCAKRKALCGKFPPRYRHLLSIENQFQDVSPEDVVVDSTAPDTELVQTLKPPDPLQSFRNFTDVLHDKSQRFGEFLSTATTKIRTPVRKFFESQKLENPVPFNLTVKDLILARKLKAVIALQAAWRGAICRANLYTADEFALTKIISPSQLCIDSPAEDTSRPARANGDKPDEVYREGGDGTGSDDGGSDAGGRVRDDGSGDDRHDRNDGQKEARDSEGVGGSDSESFSQLRDIMQPDILHNQFSPQHQLPNQSVTARIRPNLSIVTSPIASYPHDKNMSGLDSVSLASMDSTSSVGKLRTPIASAVKSGFKVASRVSTDVLDKASLAKNVLTSVANIASNATQEYLLRQKLQNERNQRRKAGKVNITDALINIRGTLVSDIPTIDIKWYMVVFPKASYTRDGIEIDNVSESWKDVNIASSSADPKILVNSEVNGSGSNQGERTQTMNMRPFSLESLVDLSFFVHLTDISRYKSIEICIFMENEGTSLSPRSSANGGISRSEMDAVPTQDFAGTRFVPAFFGECLIGRGSVFGPGGGRMNVTLRPNTFEVLQLPHGRRMVSMKGLHFLVTLLPVAQPSSFFLRSFQGLQRPAPCYPSCLVDCEHLESVPVQWDVFYGSAVCSASFKGKILVSTRRNGLALGIAEFNDKGEHVGLSAAPHEDIGTVIAIHCGFMHVACCGSSGNVMILRESADADKSANPKKPSIFWSEPVFIYAFEDSKIVAGCVSTHSNIDFFFFADTKNEICVVIMDRGECVRCAINSSFISSQIKTMSIFSWLLYIADVDGAISVVNLQSIFEGEIEIIGQLHRLMQAQESIFTAETGISCMAICAPNSFLGLKNEDENKKLEQRRLKQRIASQNDDSVVVDVVEGHLIAVGGGDHMPTVKILQPYSGGMREIVNLSGHSQAITQILIDAAGRYFITVSAGEKKIIIWDGLSFTCERIIEGISIGHASLGENCLIVTSFKAPFCRLWTAKIKRKKKFMESYASEEDKRIHELEVLCGVDASAISTVRIDDWCRSMLKGGFKPKKATFKPSYLDSQYIQVLWRWTHQYARLDSGEVDDDSSASRRRMARMRSKEAKLKLSRLSGGVIGGLGFLSGPATPLHVRRAETPRARARRKFEKSQYSLASLDVIGHMDPIDRPPAEMDSGPADTHASSPMTAAGSAEPAEMGSFSLAVRRRNSMRMAVLKEELDENHEDLISESPKVSRNSRPSSAPSSPARPSIAVNVPSKTSELVASGSEHLTSQDHEVLLKKTAKLIRKEHFSDDSDSDVQQSDDLTVDDSSSDEEVLACMRRKRYKEPVLNNLKPSSLLQKSALVSSRIT